MNNLSHTISVIIPVYNDAENLRYCLASIEDAKGCLPIEIIVIDDGSTDKTSAVIEGFNVRYIRHENNHGQGRARNYGASLAESEYLLFIDSDVVVPGNCFNLIEEFFSINNQPGLVGMQGVFSLVHPFNGWYSIIYNTLQHLVNRKPVYNFQVNSSFLLIKSEEFQNIGRFREDIAYLEDIEFSKRMAAKGRYIFHGSILFIHRKKVTWQWFYLSFILGGKLLNILSRIKPVPDSKPLPIPKGVGVNQSMLIWLIEGIMFIVAIILLILNNGILNLYFYAILGISFLVTILLNFCILWRIKKNILFFIFGSLNYMLVPWLIVFGRFAAIFSSKHDNFLKYWKDL